MLLYGVWPFLWLVRLVLTAPRRRMAGSDAPGALGLGSADRRR